MNFRLHTKPNAIADIISHVNSKIHLHILNTNITNFKAVLFSFIRQLYNIFQWLTLGIVFWF